MNSLNFDRFDFKYFESETDELLYFMNNMQNLNLIYKINHSCTR